MGLGSLALVLALGLLGPLLATPQRTRIPVVVGEILAGVVVGRSGFGWVNPADPILAFLASAGFALVMMVAGSHVPARNPALRSSLRRGLILVVIVAALGAVAGPAVAAAVGIPHGALYAVLLVSSSAALVMPVLTEAGLSGDRALALIVQVAIADTAGIVLLPLVEEPTRAARAAAGVVAVMAAGAVLGVARWQMTRTGAMARIRHLSKQRTFGLELRLSLIAVFALAGLAAKLGVSVMLAGFVAGLSLAIEGEPRRLARQLFAVADGFLGPVFFVWLGASLNLSALLSHPKLLLLTALLSVATVAVHTAVRVVGQPLPLAILAGAQLGVPVAAVTIGTKDHLLVPGEGAAIIAAAMISIAVTSLAAARAVRQGSGPAVAAADPPAQASTDGH